MKLHKDIQNAIDAYTQSTIDFPTIDGIEFDEVTEIVIESTLPFYEPEDIESKRAANLGDTLPFIRMHRNMIIK